MKTRKISEQMMTDFLSGKLKSLLDAVIMDDTLDLELRGNFVNIYYRGGSLFKITENDGDYLIYFNTKYCLTDTPALEEYPNIENAVSNIPFYKQAMDWWFKRNPLWRNGRKEI